MNEKTLTLFQEHDIKPTSARGMIYEILTKAAHPLSGEQIRTQMRDKVDKATFYRNIALFEEAGIVQKFEGDERKWYFELSKKPHAHFVCERCHNVICVNFQIDGAAGGHEIKNIVMRGVCKDCRSATPQAV
jgi:Fur family ferric uptake transcriptional regulator